MKLKDDYIKKIEFLQKEYSSIAYELGSIEMQLLTLNSDKSRLLNEYKDLQVTEMELLNSIKEEYGEGEINLQDKTFIKQDG